MGGSIISRLPCLLNSWISTSDATPTPVELEAAHNLGGFFYRLGTPPSGRT